MQKVIVVFLFSYFSLFAQKGSLLEQSEFLISSTLGKKREWHYPYAIPRPFPLLEKTSVWIKPKFSLDREYFSSLAKEENFSLLQEIGIDGIDLGQLFLTSHSSALPFPSDAPIAMEINPDLGTLSQLISLLNQTEREKITAIATAQVGTTGWGKDFYLALRALPPFPGIYHMVEIEEEHWDILPKMDQDQLIHTLSRKEMEDLIDLGYIIGLFSSICKKGESLSWNVTNTVKGVDGKNRRWVYLSFGSPMQPCMNWTDPSFSAERIFSGYLVFLSQHLHTKLIHIDANPFLGIEKGDGKNAWTANHPLTLTAVETMAQLSRKMGSATALDIDMALEDLASFFTYGPEFIFDKSSQSIFLSTLQQKKTKELREFFERIHHASIPLSRVIHPIFTTKKDRDRSTVCCPEFSQNRTLIEELSDRMKIDLYHLSEQDREKMGRAHLLYTMFYIMQPGIISFSFDDLKGSYFLEQCDQENKKCSLYGSMQKQLKSPSSYLSKVKSMIKARKVHHIESAKLSKIIDLKDGDVFAFFLRTAPSDEMILVAYNFSSCPKGIKISSREFVRSWAINIIERKNEEKDLFSSEFLLQLPPQSGKAIHFQPKFE